jgi:PadR family transcriptional regulator, regulatory protein AphA
MDRAYLAGQGAFPQRAAPNQLGGRFLTDFYAMVAHWADWATTIVQDWPDDPRQAILDQTTQKESVRIAERIATTNPTPINEHWYSNRRS